jgi:hypothetical protein
VWKTIAVSDLLAWTLTWASLAAGLKAEIVVVVEPEMQAVTVAVVEPGMKALPAAGSGT